MPVIHHSIVVPYSVSQMYHLVNDIESYPEFLPWCKSGTVLSESEDEIRATLVLTSGAFQKSFTTCNRLQKDKMIELRLVDGPFRNLQGFWQFEAQEVGSRITLDMEFEFASKLLALAFGPMFNQVVNALIDAFAKRATDLYGA